MRFDVGLLDRLFGMRTLMEVPLPDGSLKKVRVTEAWLNKSIAEDKLKRAPDGSIALHICGPFGLRVDSRVVGEDITQEQCDRFRDVTTGALYGLEVYREGVPNLSLVPKATWEQAKKLMG